MISKYFLLVAFAFVGASSAPLVSGFNGVVGPTVSETVVSPFHRTDSVSTPCGRSVVRTTALPVGNYGAGFLGAGAGVYPGMIGAGLTGTTGIYPGVVGAYQGFGLGGSAAALYPGIAAGNFVGTAGGVYGGNFAGAGLIGGGIGLGSATVV